MNTNDHFNELMKQQKKIYDNQLILFFVEMICMIVLFFTVYSLIVYKLNLLQINKSIVVNRGNRREAVEGEIV
jgi:hypothetical protein